METTETTLGQAAEASHHTAGQTTVLGLAKRPKIDYETNCKPISLVTNYVLADFLKEIQEIFLLRFDFSPIIEADNRVLREKLIAASRPQLLQCLGNKFLVSGSLIFTAQKPNFTSETILKIVYLKGAYSLAIRIIKSSKIDPSEEGITNCTQILNQLIRGMMKSLQFSDFLDQGQYFEPASSLHQKIDGTNLSLLKGWRPQFTTGREGILMRLEQTQAIGRNESVLSYINNLYKVNAAMSKEEKRQLVKKKLTGQSVMCNYGGFRKLYIRDVVFDKSVKEVKLQDIIPLPESSNNNKMEENGTTAETQQNSSNSNYYGRQKKSFDPASQNVTLFDYFYNKYGMKIKFEKQPLLVVCDKKQRNHFYYIPELSVLLGSPDDLSEFQLKQIVDAKLQKPEEHFKNIMAFFEKLIKESVPSVPSVNDSVNLNIEKKPLVIKAKQITPPVITFGFGGAKKDTRITLEDNSQNFNLKYPIYANGNNVFQIALLHFNDFDPKELLSSWNKTQRELKIDVKRPIEFNLGEYNSKAVSEIELVLKKEVKKEKFDIVALIAPHGLATTANYAKIKRICTIQQQMKSQFIKQSTLESKNASAASTGALTQMAAKCGAALWVAQPPGGFPDKTLIVSTSVHKTVINGQEQYVIGFVATQDMNTTKFYSRAVFQSVAKAKENKSDWVRIQKIRSLLTDAVKQYFVMNKFVPEQVIYLRENVPSYDLKEFLASEVNEIMQSFTDLSAVYTPALCVILLSTKHAFRCFSTTSNNFDNLESICNPLQGTVIDNTVTSKSLYDFYMVSLNQKSGTSIPVRYKVAYDTTSLPEGKLQELLYSQCFNYVNWNGAIKYPAPFMYAKKLAKVVANYIQEEIPESLHSSRFYI